MLSHLQWTLRETRFETAGGTSLDAIQRYAPICFRSRRVKRRTDPLNDSAENIIKWFKFGKENCYHQLTFQQISTIRLSQQNKIAVLFFPRNSGWRITRRPASQCSIFAFLNCHIHRWFFIYYIRWNWNKVNRIEIIADPLLMVTADTHFEHQCNQFAFSLG